MYPNFLFVSLHYSSFLEDIRYIYTNCDYIYILVIFFSVVVSLCFIYYSFDNLVKFSSRQIVMMMNEMCWIRKSSSGTETWLLPQEEYHRMHDLSHIYCPADG